MTAQVGPAPFGIGGFVWTGLAKVMEEAAEVIQVGAKLVANQGTPEHWSGDDLRERLIEETGDLLAAVYYMVEHAFSDVDKVLLDIQMNKKAERFERWHESERSA